MHATTTCRIVFTGSESKLEAAVDFLEKLQRGEYFYDEEENDLVLSLEEDLDLSNKEDIIEFIEMLYKGLKKSVGIHALGTLNAIESDLSQRFECQCNKNFFRYRETDWCSELEVDEDLSYEEFEEESHLDMDEDEYDEYVHRAHEGISANQSEAFGDWEYIE